MLCVLMVWWPFLGSWSRKNIGQYYDNVFPESFLGFLNGFGSGLWCELGFEVGKSVGKPFEELKLRWFNAKWFQIEVLNRFSS